MLLEFPHGHMPVGGDKLVAWLRGRGIRPMIAHPERNKDIMRDLAKLQPYVDAGCFLQLTADAVAGGFGPVCQARALEMLERGWVTIMASDAHDTEARPPRLRPGVARAAQLIGGQAARDLVEATPQRIVEGA
jgi:protein-tyrosine phosphatase